MLSARGPIPLHESPFWFENVPDSAPSSSPLPDRADVVVVGAGYTGLAAARELARAGASVAVLEEETVGYGASSRNGGQVLTGLKLGAGELVEAFGRQRARELYGASIEAIERLERLIADERIDCEYARSGHIEAAFTPAHFRALEREQEVLAAVFDREVHVIPRAGQRSELGSDFYHGVLVDDRSGGLHPVKYVRGLAAAAMRAGAKVHERTRATAIERRGTLFAVSTGRTGRIDAGAVLVATNAYTGRLVPALARRVVPIASSIIATEPLASDRAASVLPGRRMAFDTKNFVYYFRLSADNRLLFGGRAEFRRSTPTATRKSAEILRRGMVKVFPELADVRVEYVWSGNVAFTRDLFPHVGRLDGVHYAMGYCGHGVALATRFGMAAANLILGRDDPMPFVNLPFRPFPLYNGTPWFLPLAGAWYTLLDWVA